MCSIEEENFQKWKYKIFLSHKKYQALLKMKLYLSIILLTLNSNFNKFIQIGYTKRIYLFTFLNIELNLYFSLYLYLVII